MTSNQIAYWSLQENKRHNRETEDINRSSVGAQYAAIAENRRANMAREDETYRSNLARELETNRANMAKELELQRSNIAKETETNRSNLANEALATWKQESSDYFNSKHALLEGGRFVVDSFVKVVNGLSGLSQ